MGNPAGFDADLAARARAVAGGGRIHTVANLIESYHGAAVLGRTQERDECEQRLRRFIVAGQPMTHRFCGKHPAARRNQLCRVIDRSSGGRYLVVQFVDGVTESCTSAQVRREAESRINDAQRCDGCGNSGWHLSLVKRLCQECRTEMELMSGESVMEGR